MHPGSPYLCPQLDRPQLRFPDRLHCDIDLPPLWGYLLTAQIHVLYTCRFVLVIDLALRLSSASSPDFR
ncbi:unnamed protein product [Heligmosomoides polygyrus]|uniref:Uncharacterized protein n=1 Tax=Heligmosomoides polygyrus TaxID=6339 RepID=A0A183GCQ9_HELPZ|nr:unnamed protein product [Heligmosomoides polygyrus]